AKTTVFLTNWDNYDEINRIYREYFPEKFPARSALQVLSLPGFSVVVVVFGQTRRETFVLPNVGAFYCRFSGKVPREIGSSGGRTGGGCLRDKKSIKQGKSDLECHARNTTELQQVAKLPAGGAGPAGSAGPADLAPPACAAEPVGPKQPAGAAFPRCGPLPLARPALLLLLEGLLGTRLFSWRLGQVQSPVT
ncbi:hypothetical protein IscW_ISCW022510, partial [Ixodes scapularis]